MRNLIVILRNRKFFEKQYYPKITIFFPSESFIKKFSCVSVCVYVCVSVRNMLPNHAYYGDEAFEGESVGLGLGQRLDFI